MNKDKLFSFISELTIRDITEYKDNLFHYMNLNGSFPKTVYGLMFDKEYIKSGLFIKIQPIVYCGQDYDNSIGDSYLELVKHVNQKVNERILDQNDEFEENE